MRMSISTTSGRSRRGDRDRLVAVVGFADHLDVVLGVEQRPEPAADQRLVVGQHHADHAGHDRVPVGMPAAGSGPGTPAGPAAPASSSPPSARTRSRMPVIPCPPATAPVGPRPSSCTCTTSASGSYVELHHRVRRTGVPGDVGQRLLGDPVRRGLDGVGSGRRAPWICELHRDAPRRCSARRARRRRRAWARAGAAPTLGPRRAGRRPASGARRARPCSRP